MIGKHVGKAIGFVLIVYCVAVAISLVGTRSDFQWDFKCYYYAAKAYASGQNPYEFFFLAGVGGSGAPKGFKMINPPTMLLFINLFTATDYDTAFHLFFAVECAALIGLIYMWGWKFLGEKRDVLFFVFCLTAFGSPLYIALKAGNSVIIEQCVLWLALYFLLRRRIALFCLFTLVSGLFKGTPLLFLGLLFILGGEKKYRYFAGTVIVLLVGLLVFYLCVPVLVTGFLRGAAGLLGEKVSVSQPSTFALLTDLFSLLREETGVTLPQGIQVATYLALVAVILLVSRRAFIRLLGLQQAIERDTFVIFLACMVYALILPHFEDYSYIAVLLPAYAILRGISSRNAHTIIFVFIILSSAGITLPLFRPLVRLVLIYSPLITAYLLWGMYVTEIRSLSQSCNIRGGSR
jgi:hypothetical protein